MDRIFRYKNNVLFFLRLAGQADPVPLNTDQTRINTHETPLLMRRGFPHRGQLHVQCIRRTTKKMGS